VNGLNGGIGVPFVTIGQLKARFAEISERSVFGALTTEKEKSA
jgi:hypothetical protein